MEISSDVCCHTSGCGPRWHRDYYTFSANCGHTSWSPEQMLGAIAEAWADVRQSPLHSVGFMMFSRQQICSEHRISNLSGYSGRLAPWYIFFLRCEALVIYLARFPRKPKTLYFEIVSPETVSIHINAANNFKMGGRIWTPPSVFMGVCTGCQFLYLFTQQENVFPFCRWKNERAERVSAGHAEKVSGNENKRVFWRVTGFFLYSRLMVPHPS